MTGGGNASILETPFETPPRPAPPTPLPKGLSAASYKFAGRIPTPAGGLFRSRPGTRAGIMERMKLSQPKSLVAFLGVAGVGFLLFLPLAVVGMAYAKPPFLLTGLAGAGIAWLAAAAVGIWLANGVMKGKYRDLHPMPWRDQVW